MPNFCMVLNCGSNSARDVVSFYRIPSEHDNNRQLSKLSSERRKAWVNSLKRADLTESKIKNGRICSKHFISGKPSKSRERTNVDWVPSLNMGYGTPVDCLSLLGSGTSSTDIKIDGTAKSIPTTSFGSEILMEVTQHALASIGDMSGNFLSTQSIKNNTAATNMENICRLCLTQGNDFEAIEAYTKGILHVLHLNLDLDVSENPAMCKRCAEHIHNALLFKSTCTNTELILVPLTTASNINKINLKLIHEVNNVTQTVGKDVCCFCVTCLEKNVFTSLYTLMDNEILSEDMLTQFVPEIDYKLILDPVVCSSCERYVTDYTHFAATCLFTEEKIKRYCEQEGTNSQGLVKLGNVLAFSSKHSLEFSLLKPTPRVKETPIVEQSKLQIEAVDITEEPKPVAEESEEPKTSNGETTSGNIEFQCNICDYRTKLRRLLNIHSKKHQDHTETTLYACERCNFDTENKSLFDTHMTLHKDVSDGGTYTCKMCNFRTKVKGDLEKHLVFHKDILVEKHKLDKSEQSTTANISKYHRELHLINLDVIYGCGKCIYKTSHKGRFKSHLQLHKPRSEVNPYGAALKIRNYVCSKCGFQTKSIDALKQHRQNHVKSQPLQCKVCNFSTEHTIIFNQHVQLHEKGPTKDTDPPTATSQTCEVISL